MPLESRRFRGLFDPQEEVYLKQICFTPGQVFNPGKYFAWELPDVAFEMGLVERSHPSSGEVPDEQPES